MAENSRKSMCKRGILFNLACPIYFSCQDCGKYRGVKNSFNYDVYFARLFKCSDCKVPESKEVMMVRKDKKFLKSVCVPLLTRNNIAYNTMEDHYFYPECGLNPLQNSHSGVLHETLKGAGKEFALKEEPFFIFDDYETGTVVRPDEMEADEIIEFPQFRKSQAVYLGVRNTLVGIWFLNRRVPVDMRRAKDYYICPGLARIQIVEQILPKVARFLSAKGIINYGIIPKSVDYHFETKKKIAIIGSGMSGLACARSLKFHGVECTVYEAKNRMGGRCFDDHSLGVAVGRGAQIVVGYKGNPIYTLMEQSHTKFKIASENCPLIDASNGNFISDAIDEKMDQYRETLHELHKNSVRTINPRKDIRLAESYSRIHQAMGKELGISENLSERVYQFHLGNLEFACGAPLEEVSGRHFDQNENVFTHGGEHLLIQEGVGKLIEELAYSNGRVNVLLEKKVMTVDYTGKRVKLEFADGEVVFVDKVVLTLSNWVMQNNPPTFLPPLPKKKRYSLKKLGCGLIEKVSASFTEPFWKEVISSENYANNKMNFFGHVPESEDKRKLFNIIYDLSDDSNFVLMSYFAADAARHVNDWTEEEKIDAFVKTLQKMFPNKNVNKLDGFATSWGSDPEIGMSYSYIPFNASGRIYDNMAETVEEKLYFAGEGTSRYFPQTITGAYISGQREAAKILLSLK